MILDYARKNKLLLIAITLTVIRLTLTYLLGFKSMATDIFDIATNLSWVFVWGEYVQRTIKMRIGKGNLLLSIFMAILILGGSVGIFIANAYTMLIFFQNYIQ